MSKLRVVSCKLAVVALALLLSTNTLAATLARQCGALGIVTYDLPPVTETQTTPVPVPYAWLDAHVPGVAHESEAYEAAAMATAANGRKVWECYVVGLDPQKMDEFKISAFPMKADGTPDFESITISPPQSKWNVQGATLRKMGKATLEDAGEWQTVTDENKADMRFFKVEVVLP